jgi:phenylpropionate dioxygenase-like ring-hydroxylating dioxygenase large terminal subunit
MLTQAENERLTRVGPGSPMGRLFRRYWIPALLSEELVEPDGAPVRVRLLGEDLIAYRDTSGAVGLVGAYCPHRRAPMFFGRNEELGLRCVYHGWKFDRHGSCVDMPSEPSDSLFKTKVRTDAYPTWEGGGIVWTYMGPPEQRPPVPEYELVRTPPTHRFISKTYEECNFLQALEGGVDPTHATIMHNMNIGDRSFLHDYDSLVASIDIEKTEYGYTYAGIRSHGEQRWVRIYHWIAPAFHMRGSAEGLFRGLRGKGDSVPTIDGHIWIPIDDENTWVYNFMYSCDPATPLPRDSAWEAETKLGRGDNLLPGYLPKQNRHNDYLVDRETQRLKTFTGIDGINTQDFALQEGMGRIVDRTKEHLGTTDRAIIMMRQIFLEAIAADEAGLTVRGLDPATYRGVRGADRLVPAGLDWKDALKDDFVAKF